MFKVEVDDADVVPAVPDVGDDTEMVTFVSGGRPSMKVSTLMGIGDLVAHVEVALPSSPSPYTKQDSPGVNIA